MSGYKAGNGSPLDFTRSLHLNSKLVLKQVNEKCYEVARALFTSIVNQTPSPAHPGDTARGLLVNNWFPVDGNTFSEDTTDTTSPYGAGSLARIRSLFGRQFLGRDGVVTMSNNLPYAYRAEALGWPKKDGWTGRVGPYRMVAKSLQAIGAKYK